GLIGGVTLLILCICTVLTEGKNAFSQFINYVKDGLRYAMGVFAPIVMMAGFFFMGTAAGSEQIFLKEGAGFFYDYTILLAEWIPLTKWTVVGLVTFTAVLASLDGSGFSCLPLVGGMAIALSQVSQIPAVPLAVLGQVVGIWTGAALIPWGFAAVTSAVAGVDVQRLMKYILPAYLAAILTALGWTLFQL
ncbi:MAG: citrate transporter, partial [Desulfitobacterium hafniense]